MIVEIKKKKVVYDWNTRLTRSMKRVHDWILTHTRGVASIIYDTRMLQGEHQWTF